MSKKYIQPQLLKGFQDLLPEEMIARQRVIDTIRTVYEKFGFSPLDSPVVERFDVLTGVAGEEVSKEIFRFETPEGDQAALRFDLTVPFARLISQYRDTLKLPLRRYHIGPVFRADKPGPGRFRQFYQCDVDIAGARSLGADAEVVAVLCETLRALGLGPSRDAGPQYRARISNRRLVDALLHGNNIGESSKIKHTLRVIDKLRKVGSENVRLELSSGRIDDSGDPISGAHLPDAVIESILSFVAVSGPTRAQVIALLQENLPNTMETQDALLEMRQLDTYLHALGISEGEAIFDPSLTRGLDYYTGPVYEIEVPSAFHIGSIGGGGRYNELCARFMPEAVPATGASIGLDRLMAALCCLNKSVSTGSNVQVCIATVGKVPETEVFRTATQLRAAGFNTLTYLGGKKNMGAQLSDADRYRIPVAVILGEDELQRDEVTIKDMVAGKQEREAIQDHDAYRQAGRNAQETVPRSEMISAIALLLQRYA